MEERNTQLRKKELVNDRGFYCRDENTNKALVSGEIVESLQVNHVILGERFFKTTIKVTRMSGNEDLIPVHVSERLLTNMIQNLIVGNKVRVSGQIRSYNRRGVDGEYHLNVVLFAWSFELLNNEEDLQIQDKNSIELEGYICRPTVYRNTLTRRQITDMFIIVHRSNNNYDYIPCIAWGRNALYARDFKVGDKIKLWGRVQSREYYKSYSDQFIEGTYRTVHEISAYCMFKI